MFPLLDATAAAAGGVVMVVMVMVVVVACLLPATCSLLPAACCLLLLQHPFAMKKRHLPVIVVVVVVVVYLLPATCSLKQGSKESKVLFPNALPLRLPGSADNLYIYLFFFFQIYSFKIIKLFIY